jgi:hypothetical protein
MKARSAPSRPRQYDIWWAEFSALAGRRPVMLLTRNPHTNT